MATVASGITMATRAAAATPARPESVLVRGAAGCATQVAAAITQLGGTVTHSLGVLNGASATVGSDRIAALRSNPCVAAVTLDGSVSLSSIGTYDPTADTGSLFNTTQIIGAQSYWQAGYTGRGVSVALIDSGVSPVKGLAATPKVINGPDISFDSQSPNLVSLDGYGHGTHMASIIAGRDSGAVGTPYAGNTSNYLGVAPDARIVNVKVADAHGAADVSQVIAGIDWVVQHENDNGMNIGVINLSFGTDSLQSYMIDPLAFAAEAAWRSGIVVVVAAGNGGSTTTSLTDPAIDPFVIAVGAADTQGTNTTADDTVASFSSAGNATRSPDLVAPGVHIEGLKVPGSYIDTQFGSTASVNSRWFLGSGTSQAAAVVSGAAALVLSQYPYASPNQVKYLLTHGATPLANQPTVLQGNGELNLANTLTLAKGTSTQIAQSFNKRGTGVGTLDGARGSIHLIANGVTLAGEQDIFGNAWNSTAIASAEVTQTAWTGGTFNGSGWSGSGWSGSGWSGVTWTGSGWSGSGWSGSGWSGNVWNGSGWSGSGWSGSGWSGSGWSGSGWSGSGWSGSGWSGSGWSGSGWSGSGWSDATWS